MEKTITRQETGKVCPGYELFVMGKIEGEKRFRGNDAPDAEAYRLLGGDIYMGFRYRDCPVTFGFMRGVLDCETSDLQERAIKSITDITLTPVHEILKNAGVLRDFSEEEMESFLSVPLYMLTSSAGAGVMFSNDCLNKLHEKFGDFYILPSSVEEVLIVPCGKSELRNYTSGELVGIIREINAGPDITDDKFLSDSLFMYDGEILKVINSGNADAEGGCGND